MFTGTMALLVRALRTEARLPSPHVFRLLFVGLVPALARASSRIDAHSAELEYVATHDELTGMPNRYGFKRAAETALGTRVFSSVRT